MLRLGLGGVDCTQRLVGLGGIDTATIKYLKV